MVRSIAFVSLGSDRELEGAVRSIQNVFGKEDLIGLVSFATMRLMDMEAAAIQLLTVRLPNLKEGVSKVIERGDAEQLDWLCADLGNQSCMYYAEGAQAYAFLLGAGRRYKEVIESDRTFRACEQLIVLSHPPLIQLLSCSFQHEQERLFNTKIDPGEWWFLDLTTSEYSFPVAEKS